ncbi:hypothetical protein HAX54_014088 [Datura stramonium]|uniref:Uncharacterized protein n=1 Tax=Datura stramonium TaxID=4076 RepID=A0ABS8TPG7_DATST|nr:hypothetical protein [Datura stramonium]
MIKEADQVVRKTLAAMGNSSSDDEKDEAEEKSQSRSEIKKDNTTYSRSKLEEMDHIVINTYENLHTAQREVMDAYTSLELDLKNQGESQESLDEMIEDLRNQNLSLNNEKYALEMEKGKLIAAFTEVKDEVEDTHMNRRTCSGLSRKGRVAY